MELCATEQGPETVREGGHRTLPRTTAGTLYVAARPRAAGSAGVAITNVEFHDNSHMDVEMF